MSRIKYLDELLEGSVGDVHVLNRVEHRHAGREPGLHLADGLLHMPLDVTRRQRFGVVYEGHVYEEEGGDGR